jgi:hypothetical protein
MNRPNIDTVFHFKVKLEPNQSYVFITDHSKTLDNIDKQVSDMTEFKDVKTMLDRIKSK